MPEVDCEHCGDGFHKYQYRIDKTDNNFCSRECHQKHISTEKVECDMCGDMHYRRPTDKERYDRSFCSQDCYSEWQSTYRVGENHHQYERVENVCIGCGGTFETIPCKDWKNWCSHDCWLENADNNTPTSMWGTLWRKQRAEALERDNNTCQRCGVEGSSHHVHHKTPRSEFETAEEAHTLDNLVTLCPSCHMKVESGSTLCDLEDEDNFQAERC